MERQKKTNIGITTIIYKVQISRREQLYRIMDVTLKCTLWQRLFNVGTIHCCSGDKTTPEFDIKDVKKPSHVKELLSKNIEIQRDKKRISGREFLGDLEDSL